MPIVGMEVSTPQVSPVPFTFTVVSTTRSLTLAASTEEEKQEWYEVCPLTCGRWGVGWGWGSTIYFCFCLFQVLLKVIQDANNKFKSLKKANSLAVSRAHRVFGMWCDVCTQVHVCHQTCCTEVTLTVVSSSPILLSSPPLPFPLPSLPLPSPPLCHPSPPLPSPTPYPSPPLPSPTPYPSPPLPSLIGEC